MDTIYITGHRNPDTDSIVAAISYAALRNACGDREYEAACLGRVSDETQIVLDRFGFLPPKRITDLYNQVRDLDFDECDGCIKALIVPGPAKWMGCMGREFEVFIPWCRIVKIGPDIILVDIDEKEAKHKVK